MKKQYKKPEAKISTFAKVAANMAHCGCAC